MKCFGLIGFPLGHSFSKKYFTEKFAQEGLVDCRYDNLPIEEAQLMPELFASNDRLIGLNVTIPHKQAVVPLLDELDEEAAAVGAVNTIKRLPDGRLKGFNTDIFGFAQALSDFVPHHLQTGALILGTGGSSKAVHYVCSQRFDSVLRVSRRPGDGVITYADLTGGTLDQHRLIVNTTPAGMYPEVDACAPLAFDLLDDEFWLMDLIYNPPETRFMIEGKSRGAHVTNGYQMLVYQAERSWRIWNDLLTPEQSD